MDAQGASTFAAINTAGGQLNILGQTAGTGKLIAKGGAGGAGIGGNSDNNSLAITISGGEIEATGGSNAAGIGSGDCTSSATGNTGGDITILGGKVTATGGANAAGIGTGYSQSGDPAIKPACGSITIAKTVISVTATMGTGAEEPIGRGGKASTPVSNPDPYCGNITFDTVTAASAGVYSPAPTNGDTYGGLKLAISGKTWTLTPAN